MFEAFDRHNQLLASFWIDCGVRLTALHHNKTVLQLAVSRKWIDVIRNLVLHGANVTATDDGGESLLHQAAREGASVELVAILIDEFKLDVNAENELGFRPLHLAVKNYQIAQFLLRRGAQLESRTKSGMTALHVAVIGKFLILLLFL
jgi:ankyrin repeat protein